MAEAVWSGGSNPSLAQSNAELSSLIRLLFEFPILPVAGLVDPDAEIHAEIG